MQDSENNSALRLGDIEDREGKPRNDGSANLTMNEFEYLGIQLDGPED